MSEVRSEDQRLARLQLNGHPSMRLYPRLLDTVVLGRYWNCHEMATFHHLQATVGCICLVNRKKNGKVLVVVEHPPATKRKEGEP